MTILGRQDDNLRYVQVNSRGGKCYPKLWKKSKKSTVVVWFVNTSQLDICPSEQDRGAFSAIYLKLSVFVFCCFPCY